MSVEDDALHAADREWRSAREIHDRMACWSPITVRHALRNLHDRGLVEFKTIPHPSVGTIRKYRRTQAAQQEQS